MNVRPKCCKPFDIEAFLRKATLIATKIFTTKKGGTNSILGIGGSKNQVVMVVKPIRNPAEVIKSWVDSALECLINPLWFTLGEIP